MPDPELPGAPLRLFNSLTRRLETFAPVHPGEARVYTCGPTVYNYPHIGNMRAYVFADVLGRTLAWKGYKLTHVINITDVGHLTDDADAGEDKLEKAAKDRAQSIWDIARHYTKAYWADVRALNIREPAHWSIATEYVPQMIAFAQSIADRHCYQLPGGLYFDVSTVADYGRLAGHAAAEGEGRIEAVAGKRHPADCAIWRITPPGETRQMEWDSPWGRGAPGWHLECSVMSEALLGFPFDIHTGGIDHREIHHPNEIAQNQARQGCDHSGARLWMHNNFLVERSGKMSKSAGEFLRLQLLIDKGYHPLAYRLMCLQAHYRSELEFSWEGLAAAATRLQRLVIRIRQISGSSSVMSDLRRLVDEKQQLKYPTVRAIRSQLSPETRRAVEDFDAALSEDLNTPVALTILERAINDKGLGQRDRLRCAAIMDLVFGLDLLRLTRRRLRVSRTGGTEKISVTDKDIEAVVKTRKLLRSIKRFDVGDELKKVLLEWGVEVMDGDPLGWDWKQE
ncbi:MAG: cysteine--tRNA ligase [Novosphingobium sp.]